jgi:hypothetical protein
VFFINSGAVAVGYRLFNSVFFAKSLKASHIVGDFDCINDKVSEFLYQPIVYCRGFAMRKHHFNEIIRSKIGQRLKPKFNENYQ